jgi:hypothetical protein
LLWEDGSETKEPLEILIKDYPDILASCALKHDLLACPGRKKTKSIATKLNLKQHALGNFSLKS